MTKITKVLVLMVLAVWGLATAHCDLEQLPGFEFLAWCHAQQGVPEPANDCGADSCSVVESGFYKVDECTSTVPLPHWVLNFVLPVWESPPPATLSNSVVPDDSPPELPRVWQFSYRTALPPRAPSLVA